jgi:hypothetical protein
MPVTDLGCCAMAGPNEKCSPEGNGGWSDPWWLALKFSMDDPHYYGYYGGGYSPSLGIWNFTAWARGDLDCDFICSDFYMFLIADPAYGDGVTGTNVLKRVNELE